MAKALVDKALKNGGVIDQADFERAGPDVRRLTLDLMGSMASAEAELPPQSPVAPSPKASVASGQRIDKNWADQRQPVFDIVANPFLYGAPTAAVVGSFVVWLINYAGL